VNCTPKFTAEESPESTVAGTPEKSNTVSSGTTDPDGLDA
jgi:hypothetical protein